MTCNTNPRVTSRVERWTVGRGRTGISIRTVPRHWWRVASQVWSVSGGTAVASSSDVIRCAFPLNPGVELCQGASGGDITREGFREWASLHRSGDLEQRCFREMWNWQRDGRGCGVGVSDRRGDERQDEHGDKHDMCGHRDLPW